MRRGGGSHMSGNYALLTPINIINDIKKALYILNELTQIKLKRVFKY